MIPGRSDEYKYLDNAYKRDGSQILILYGRQGIGKSSLIKDFCKDKSFFYLMAENVSENTLLDMWKNSTGSLDNSYPAIFDSIFEKINGKAIICIDEFQNILKNSNDFMENVISLIHKNIENKECLVILMSSDTDFIENDMVSRIGALAYELSGFLKVRELKFLDMVRRFPNMSVPDCIEAYAVLGGVPGLWRYFSQNLSLRENICRTILKKGTVLYSQAENEVKEQLRECEVYNTILYELANGHDKLNDIYKSTGYSRAKISVYLKNLMEIEMVVKLSSIDTPGRDNSRKGIYKICNHLVFFYYRFIFAHKAELLNLSPENFYNKYIADGLNEYTSMFFSQICSEYIDLLGQSGGLPFVLADKGSFYGKSGTIDIVGFDENNQKSICGLSKYSESNLTYSDYEKLLISIRSAKIEPQLIFLFSSQKFDDEIVALSNDNKKVKLIDLSML